MATRRRPFGLSPLALALLTTAAGFAFGAAAARDARAQVPQPRIPSTPQRSGLMTRFVPIEPGLPHDPKRDDWYDTRFGDAPNLRKHPNVYHNGGLYGLRWRTTCSRSIYPFFYGAPGRDTISEDCCPPPRPVLRPLSALVHPFKPVGMYYDQGSYVPVYDLDPVVPGPGPMIFPWFPKDTSHGG